MSDLYSADDDHPLKSADISFSNLSIAEIKADKINSELQSVAVDWKPLRSTTACACATPFDQIVRKVFEVWPDDRISELFPLSCRVIVGGAVKYFVRGVLIVRLPCLVMQVVNQFQFVAPVIGPFSKIVRRLHLLLRPYQLSVQQWIKYATIYR